MCSSVLFEDCQWLSIKNLHLMYNGHSAFSVLNFFVVHIPQWWIPWWCISVGIVKVADVSCHGRSLMQMSYQASLHWISEEICSKMRLQQVCWEHWNPWSLCSLYRWLLHIFILLTHSNLILVFLPLFKFYWFH